jgi:hypothetical protein
VSKNSRNSNERDRDQCLRCVATTSSCQCGWIMRAAESFSTHAEHPAGTRQAIHSVTAAQMKSKASTTGRSVDETSSNNSNWIQRQTVGRGDSDSPWFSQSIFQLVTTRAASVLAGVDNVDEEVPQNHEIEESLPKCFWSM